MSMKKRTALLTIANYDHNRFRFGRSFGSLFYPYNPQVDVTTVNWYPDKDYQKTEDTHEWFHALKHVTPPEWKINAPYGPTLQVTGIAHSQGWRMSKPGGKWEIYSSLAYGDGTRWEFFSQKTDQPFFSLTREFYAQRITPTGYIELSDSLYQMILLVEEWVAIVPERFPDSHPTQSDWDKMYMLGQEVMAGAPVATATIKQVTYDPVEVVPVGPPSGWFDFKHNELTNYQWFKEFGLISNFYSSGYAQAFVDMCDDIPKFHGNQIANATESLDLLIGIFTSILSGNFAKAILSGLSDLKDIRNVHLAWRYSYNTTKSDVNEATTVVNRLKTLNAHDVFHIRGVHIDGDALFRCSALISLDELFPGIDEMSEWLDKVGLELNAERAWDMVPFSFMADWILHVSDWLHQLETVKKYGATLKVGDVWVSCRTQYDDQTVYMRHNYKVRTRDLPLLPVPSWTASNKTFFLRTGDVFSIFSK